MAKIKASKLVSIEVPKDVAELLKTEASQRGVDIPTFLKVALRNVSPPAKEYDLKDTLLFGKYNGLTLETVIKCDPKYIRWVSKNVDTFGMSDAACDLLAGRDT